MVKKALAGIKALDLSRQFPGPYCTMILADFGAEVLRVEDRRFINDPNAWPVMRNKKHMSLNLTTPQGRKIFLQLTEKADIIVEGFRPGATARMGVSYEDIKKIKPDIIYCSLSGYGQTGPYGRMPGHDVNYIAAAGLLGLCGETERAPIIPPVQIADVGGGLNAAIGILIALFHRERTGEGQYIDVSLADSAMGFMTLPLMQYADSGIAPERGKMPLVGFFPFYRVYETKDKKYLTIGAIEPRFWKTLCETIGCAELEKDQICSGERLDEVLIKLKKIFKQKTRDDWFDILKDADVCVGRVLAMDELRDDPQIKDRKMIVEIEFPDGKMKPVQGIVAKLGGTPGEIVSIPASFGEHTEEVLKELGYSEGDIKQFFEKGVC